MAEVKVLGRIRKMLEAVDPASPGEEKQLTLSPQLELLIAQGAAPYREIVRTGRAFYVNTTAAVASILPATGLTTAHSLALYNGEPDGGRSYVIDWVACTNVVTTTSVAAQAQLMGLVGQVREAIPTDAGLTIKKANGMGGTVDSKARTILTATALPGTTGLQANWFPIATNGIKPNVVAATTDVGYGCYSQIDGRLILSPGRYFAMATYAQATTETFVCFIGWHEVQLQLG